MIHKDSYDLVISFSNRKFSRVILPFVKTKKIVSGLDLKTGEEKEAKRCLKVVKSLGTKQQGSEIQFNISRKDKSIVNKILKGKKIFGKDIVVLHLLTPLVSKNWPEENWIKLIKKINPNNKVFVLIGTGGEKGKLDKIKSQLDGLNVVNLAGKMDLVQLIYFMRNVKLYIGGDSGPMHIANLVKIPSVILFGQTNEKIWGPEEDYGKILKKKNIRDITVEEVFKSIK
ncbi:MAG: glycosyltransferase family 9 protein [Parcubacteria group bacterium]|nr:glycosyltransferase family 9 protein [Parcubacteria group bacterium]